MALRKFTDVANELRKHILSGRFGVEGGLPEVRELALRYGVAKNTVTAALSNLEGQGLIEKRGHSYYVNQLSVIMTEHVPVISTRLSSGKGYYKNIGTVERIAVPEHLVEKLKAPSGKIAVFRAQLSGEIIDGNEKPLQIAYRYHLLDLSDEQVQRMQDDPTHDPLRDDEYATQLFSSDEFVPRLATEEERGLLNLPENTPITHLFEAISKDSNLIMVQEIILSPRSSLIFAFPFDNKPKQ